MSYYSHFGAYRAPAETHGFLKDVTQAEGEFHGSSRSEAFQKACNALLDFLPGHDLLRFLSDQSATHRLTAPGGLMNFTRIEPSAAKFYVGQLDDLLLTCRNRPGELATLWLDYLGGYPTEDVVSALSSTKVCRNLTSETYHGEDGDSPHFAIATLTTLRVTITHVCSAGSTLVYYSWQGE
jgi:hypothetical protein